MSEPLRLTADGMPPTRSHAVAAKVRDLILSGELKPGERLRQNEVAGRLKVSSTPVREAFLLLSRQGFVELDTHRGAIVFSPTPEAIRENYEIRAALESLAAGHAARNVTAAKLREIEVVLEQMRVAGGTDLEHHTRVLNPRFHMAINTLSGRPALISIIRSMRDLSLAYHELLLVGERRAPEEYARKAQEEHDEIVAALRARAPKRAARAVETHIKNHLEETLTRLREVPHASR
jgi:DNA-binding GntR family transcriptional regulator